MEKIDNRYILIGIAALLIIICISGTVFLTTRPAKQSFVPTTRTDQVIPTVVAQTPQPTPTVVTMQTPTPTKRPIIPGSIWAVYQIVYQAHHIENFNYDVATFTNIETGETLTAHCAEPGWPSPPLGTHYRINSAGVLIPLIEDEHRPYQRFILLVY